MVIFEIFLCKKFDPNIHENSPNCTIFKNFLGGGGGMPPNLPSYATCKFPNLNLPFISPFQIYCAQIMAFLLFEKDIIWEKLPYFPIQNILCIEYGHLDFWTVDHDLGKAPLFCSSKLSSALFVYPDFKTKK